MRKVLTTTMEPDTPEHHSATATRGAKTGKTSMLVGWLHGRSLGHTEQSRIGLPVRNLDHLVTSSSLHLRNSEQFSTHLVLQGLISPRLNKCV
jgi:hypothetical protein